MKSKSKGWYAIAIILCFVFPLLSWKFHDIKGMRGNLKNNDANAVDSVMYLNNEEVDLASKKFIKCIKSGDYDEFKTIISPSGLTIVKNYTYSDGVRGRDLRGYYSVQEIPNDMCFSVENGFSMSLKELFKDILDDDAGNVKQMDIENVTFNFITSKESRKTLPSTEEIWGICESIRTAGSSQESTQIYNLNDKEFVLTSSDYNSCKGGWAVFEKVNNKYCLRAILDFR